MKNYWFIGDIHGEIRLLDRLLPHVQRFSPEAVIFVGDYIDRGAHSREVVDRILELEVPVHCLLGNHEMMMLDAIEHAGIGYSPVELWYYNGGETTLQSFGYTSFFSFQSGMDAQYLDFFRNLKLSHEVRLTPRRKVVAVHAGISPSIPLEDQLNLENYRELNNYMIRNHIQPEDSFLWVREEFYQGDPGKWDGYVVVHGHTPVLKMKRFIAKNGQRNFLFVENDLCIRKDEKSGRIVSIDIDSGSVVSGRLTGLGFFIDEEGEDEGSVRIRSLTVTTEEIFPRDLGPVL
ncbi:MAG TPA: serine/threonine protein phosphatase [Bacteroides sp.]|nr:serine/threonine protein phosphatase [Bacteroides sp.]